MPVDAIGSTVLVLVVSAIEEPELISLAQP